ncbi:hypothetical protein M9Y10_000860 [Tritrichomonas musculus]|uniref:Initiator binding domain-containing protein n=1 Tax=Tritrichomonas musculus TaxID=1915356 RepID=A0ABR2L5D6_9EUKA
MLKEIQHWESMTPIKLASKLKQRAFMKRSLNDIDQAILQYFSQLHSKKSSGLSNIQIGDELSLLAYFAEIFSNDPIYQILHWGMVIFNDSVCINVNSLSRFLSLPINSMLESMRKANYTPLRSLPPNCFKTLMQLGFITSLEFSMYTISPADPFFIHIGCHPIIVQPFPLELIDLLLFAKREVMNLEKSRLNKYIESARKRVEFQNSKDQNEEIEYTSQNSSHEEEEEEEVES